MTAKKRINMRKTSIAALVALFLAAAVAAWANATDVMQFLSFSLKHIFVWMPQQKVSYRVAFHEDIPAILADNNRQELSVMGITALLSEVVQVQ
jgi:hypothetical protein